MNSVVSATVFRCRTACFSREDTGACVKAATQVASKVIKRWAHKNYPFEKKGAEQTNITAQTPVPPEKFTNAQKEKLVHAFVALYVTNYRTTQPPKHISLKKMDEVVAIAQSLGVSREEVLHLFEENAIWNLNRMTPNQLSETSWLLFQARSKATDVQSSILRIALQNVPDYTKTELDRIKYVNMHTFSMSNMENNFPPYTHLRAFSESSIGSLK